MARSSWAAADATFRARLWAFCDERLGLSEWISLARKKTVPQHAHAFWYYMGGICIFLFTVQLVTGLLLLIYYRPGPEAYDSVRRITYDIDFGWLVRSAHSWSANLMMLAVFVHLFSVMFMKAYRRPREITWWSGLALLGLTQVFGFSGYLLPMDELAYFATKVGLEIPASIPVVGPWMADLVRGGPMVDENTIQRFFALHVFVLPLAFFLVLGLHLYLVQRHGNAVPPGEAAKPASERRAIPFFPDFFVKDLAMWLVMLNLLALLVSLAPWDLGPQADPLVPAPEGIHPEWYFMSQFQLLKVLGRWLPGAAGEAAGLAIGAAVGLLLLAIPLVDRADSRAAVQRAAWWAAAGLLAGLVVFTVWGYAAL